MENKFEQREKPKIEVWLIDDSEDVTGPWKAMVDALYQSGMTFRTFSKGEEAVGELQRRLENGEALPHGMIIDGNLNEDTGEYRQGSHVVGVIRKTLSDRKERVYLFAHGSYPDDNEAMRSAGADAILEKPAGLQAITNAMKQIQTHHEKQG